jgi:hypothetical protein
MTRKLCVILVASLLVKSIVTANQQQIIDALYIPLEEALKEGCDTRTHIGYLNAFLQEHDLKELMANRLLRLVQLNGGKDPTLYFLLLDSRKIEMVRSSLKEDMKNFTDSSGDQKLILDFLCLFSTV